MRQIIHKLINEYPVQIILQDERHFYYYTIFYNTLLIFCKMLKPMKDYSPDCLQRAHLKMYPK